LGSVTGVILTPFLLAVLLAIMFFPLINYLEKQGLSRSIGIVAVYLFFTALCLLFCMNLLPSLFNELQELAAVLPEYTDRLLCFLEEIETDYRRYDLPGGIRAAMDENIRQMQQALVINLEKFSQFLIMLLSQAFGLLLIPVILYYLLRDCTVIKEKFLGVLPEKYRLRMEITVGEIGKTLGAYLRGVVIISLFVGGLLYGGLLALGVKFALFLAIINALTNVIPYFGPLIGAFPVVIIAYLQSPVLVWKVIALIFIIQQVESQFIAPQILGRNLGFHPLTVILVLLLAGKFLGFFGLVFIIPFLAIIRVILLYFSPVIKEAWREIRCCKK